MLYKEEEEVSKFVQEFLRRSSVKRKNKQSFITRVAAKYVLRKLILTHRRVLRARYKRLIVGVDPRQELAIARSYISELMAEMVGVSEEDITKAVGDSEEVFFSLFSSTSARSVVRSAAIGKREAAS